MPSVYLSPSTQDFNQYINGGNEEYYMNLIADAMVPYLRANNITFGRNDPNQSLAQAIANSNAGNYNFHLALHSNSSPDHLKGQLRGPNVYYYATSSNGKRMSDLIANNLKNIYPDPALIQVLPTTTLAELRRTKAPAALVEVAYHDNWQDAQWIKDSVNSIARQMVISLTQYFGMPFIDPYA